MLSTRILSGLIFTVLFLLGLFHHAFGWTMPLILGATSLWGTFEFMQFGVTRPTRPFLVVALLGAVVLLADGYWGQLSHALLIIGFLTTCALGLGIVLLESHVAEMAGMAVLGPLYVTLPLALATIIWRQPALAHNQDAPHYLIFLVMVTWSSDVGAYFTGRMIGRHKMAPRLSPGKTVEGFLGGILFTVLVAALMKIFWNNVDRIFYWPEIVLLALVFSVIGPIGDLAESWLKRSSGFKDSGKTFTGHGGMLDIIDSLLFTTIFYYAYLLLFYSKIHHLPAALLNK